MLRRLQAAAHRHGGECLATAYRGPEEKYPFRCAQGHAWATRPANIRNGSWCPVCAATTYWDKARRASLHRLQTLAHQQGGACLAPAYLGSVHKHAFRCAAGHIWETEPRFIQKGHWCPTCHYLQARLEFETIQVLVQQKGGRCLSDIYVNCKTPLLLMCAQGHTFLQKPSALQRGHWCQQCAHQQMRKTIVDMQAAARARGGACLSTAYINNKTHLYWQCADGHVWRATLGAITGSRKQWCPQCRAGRTKKEAQRERIAQMNMEGTGPFR
ncbi:MAG: hypothetical protein A3I66_10285 [Burkholderiales bacterium RIFCSPLOWO2_02_FULL_57_36]|nr:MAG: hypothetical protein A3I66_10285 [Burkholderiales bacterium RIFCSPLOWO2_02_FULL_57_36]